MAWGSIGGSVTGFQNFLKDALTISSAMKNESTSSSSSLGGGRWGVGGSDTPVALILFVALAMLTAFLGLLCLAACMKRFDATYSSSMFVVSFVLSTSLMSSVHYDTFQHLTGVENYIMYPMGLMILLVGAFLLIKVDTTEEARDSEFNGSFSGKNEDYQESLLLH